MNKPKLYKRGASWHCQCDKIHCWAKDFETAYANWKVRMLNGGWFTP